MQIVLFRHGIAVRRDDPDCPPDRERSLTGKGVRRTRRAAAGLARLGVRPDLVVTSPYVRTVETARIAAEALGVSATDIESWDALEPGASPAEVLDRLRERGPACALVVGHAPDLDLLLAEAVCCGSRPLTLLRKAGAASVRLNTPDGGAFTELEWVMTPRALRRLGGA